MSLILEALRKSEAERRRGQAPDLHGASILTPSPRREGVPHWPILAGGALVLIAVALLLWPRAQPDVAPGDDGRRGEAATSPAGYGDGDDGDADDADAMDAPHDRSAPPGPTPPRSAASTTGRNAPPTSMPQSIPPAPASRPAPAASPVGAPPPAPTLPRTAAIPIPTPPAAASPASDAPAAAPPADDVPTLAALSAGERAALPPLKLSVHVWDSNPKQRFAIVDGQRIVEGGTIGGAVVDEIRRDGVVLDMNGRRVLLPKP